VDDRPIITRNKSATSNSDATVDASIGHPSITTNAFAIRYTIAEHTAIAATIPPKLHHRRLSNDAA